MTEKRKPVKPRDAATVVLLRDTGRAPFEVFMMRRHARQTFMGDAHVFPGGALDETDLDPELAAYGVGLTPVEAGVHLQEPDLSARLAMGLYFAAIRETFEESGILLGEGIRNGGVRDGSSVFPAALGHYRRDIHDGKISLKRMALDEGVRFDLEKLRPYSHWITPVIEKKRFDARFFLARMPRGQTPEHDSVEMTDSAWMTPEKAVGEHYAGNLKLMPPTLITLEELMPYSSISELWSKAAERKIRPILPQVHTPRGRVGLLLPDDPEYTIEPYRQPSNRLGRTRLYLTDRGWKTARHDE